MTNTRAMRGWVLFDDSCGFCRRWVRLFQSTLGKRGFVPAPLQSDWVQQELNVPADELLADIRLVLVDGDQIRGANAYRYVMRRIWWAYPIYLMSIVPLFRQLFDWSYRTFATHRFQISRACRLPGNATSEKSSNEFRA